MAETISIQIRKGGTGKTALTYNLASMLSADGFRVLCIDLDGQGSLTLKYGIDKMTDEKKPVAQLMIAKIMNEEIDYDEYIHHIRERLDLIHGNNLTDSLVKLLALEDDPIYVLADVLDPIREDYDYILIDNAPALNQLTSNSFVASSQILMCVTPVKEAIDNIADTIDIYRRITRRANRTLRINGILFNMVDERTRDCRRWEEQIVEKYSYIPIYDTAIPVSVKVNEGNSVNKPIVDYMKDNAVAVAYRNFYREFLGNGGIGID